MDIIIKTARYIITYYGSNDYESAISKYSALLSYLCDTEIIVMVEILKTTVKEFTR